MPAVRVALPDGVTLGSMENEKTRTKTAGVVRELDLDPAVRTSADPSHRAMRYAPNPYDSDRRSRAKT